MVIHPASINMLVDDTWNFARDILWRDKSFSEEEIAVIKSFISEHYKRIPVKKFRGKALKLHRRICSYVLATKKQEYKTLPHPCIWFNDLYSDGLAGMWSFGNFESNKISNL